MLAALTLVVLASAWLRLDLYQQAYGWTELRFYVAAAIVALGAALARWRCSSSAIGCAGSAMASWSSASEALIAVNLLAPAAFVAERNVARVLDPSLVPEDGWPGLDTEYFGALGDDAVPVLVEALPALPEPYRAQTLRVLQDRRTS